MPDWPSSPSATRKPIFLTSMTEHRRLTGKPVLGTSGVWLTANEMLYLPVRVLRKTTAKKLYVQNGAAVSGNADIGLYTSTRVRSGGAIDSWKPGTRLTYAGATAQAGTSQWQIFNTADVVIAAGVYFLCFGLNNGTGAVVRQDSATGTDAPRLGYANGVWSSPSFGCPADASTVVVPATLANVPMLALGGVA